MKELIKNGKRHAYLYKGNTINSLYAFNGTTHIKTGSAALLPTVDVEVPSTVEMFLHNQREANEGTVYL